MAARSVPLTDVQGIEATRCHDVDRLDTSARPLEVGIIETDDQDDVIPGDARSRCGASRTAERLQALRVDE